MPRAYEGDQPYIFISYSHRDSETVMKVIKYLQERKFRVWYDGGIEAGSEWPEYIAGHLKNCECVLSFISEHFVDSHNCRRELIFAQEKRKPMMNVFISDVVLSDGMQMQLGLNQAVWSQNFASNEEFCEAICRARLVKDCKEPEPKPEPKPEPVKEAPKPKAAPAAPAVPTSEPPKPKVDKVLRAAPKSTPKTEAPKAAPKAAPKTEAPKAAPKATTKTATTAPKAAVTSKQEPPSDPKRYSLVNKLTCSLELSYVLFGTLGISWITGGNHGFFLPVLTILAIHVAIIILNCTILKTLGKDLASKDKANVAVNLFMLCVVSSVLAVIVGSFFVGYDVHYILKLLIALGLNLIPAAAAVVTYAVIS